MRIRHFTLNEIPRNDDEVIIRKYEMTNEKGKFLGYVLCLQYVNLNEIPRSYGVVYKNIERKMTRDEEFQFKQFLFNEFATEEQKNFNPLA